MSRLLSLFKVLGINLPKGYNFISRLPHFFADLNEIRSQYNFSNKQFPFSKLYPCLLDKDDYCGSELGHYFYQDLFVAQKIFSHSPKTHIDVGSRIDGLIAHVASFRTVKVIDIRPLPSKIINIEFIQADMMSPIPSYLHNSCDSLSSLHALEHFGLGRYNDPIEYDGYLMGLENFYNLLAPSGKFYFSVPIGPQRLEFNAHRVFSMSYLLTLFENKYKIDSFSYIDDKGKLHENIELSSDKLLNNCGCKYGCGIFELTKI